MVLKEFCDECEKEMKHNSIDFRVRKEKYILFGWVTVGKVCSKKCLLRFIRRKM